MEQEYKKENVWTHTKSNRNYRIVSDNARLKNPDTGEWVDCIIYSPLYENDYEMFSREKKSFYKEFKKVKNNKELLLKDLCARLPYGVKVAIEYSKGKYTRIYDLREIDNDTTSELRQRVTVWNYGFYNSVISYPLIDCRPYLRTMSSMTDEEETAYYKTWYDPLFDLATKQHTKEEEPMMFAKAHHDSIEFLLENHFDFLDLIPLGLAIEVTEKNNPYKE